MKKITLILIMLISAYGFGQTLTAGDIAIVEVNSDGKKPFAFITLVPIPANEEIKFTDNGWKSDNTWRTGEGIITWTAPAIGVSCGTVVHIDNPTSPDTANPFSTSIGSVTKTGTYNYAASGDQLIAYQGINTMIAGFNSNSNNWTTTGIIDTTSSYIPTGLIAGQTCISITSPSDTDNHKYNTSITDFRSTILSSIYLGNTNWNIDETIVQDYTGTIIVSDCCTDTYTWTGLPAAWSPMGSPSTTSSVIIDATYDTTTNGNLEVCSLEVTSSGNLNIQAGNFVKVTKDVLNNGTIAIANNGSFVQVDGDNNSVTGAGTFTTEVITTTIDTPKYSYFSSPVQNATMAAFTTWAQMNRLFGWDGLSTQDWTLVNSSTIMVPGVGYIARPTNGAAAGAFTTSFTGKFNNGDIMQPLYFNVATAVDMADNDNALVGNPYPSGINTADLLTENGATLNALYFWSHSSTTGSGGNWDTGEYKVWNSGGTTNGAPATIASGQGFFAMASATGTIKFTNAMRTTSNGAFLRPPTSSLDKVWLNLVSDTNIGSQILIGFNPICTDGFDAQYDAARFNSENSVSLSSNGIGNNTFNLAIQTCGLLTGTSTSIPLNVSAFDANIATLTVSIDHLENLENQDVYLVDNSLNITHNLKVSDYTFNVSQTGIITDRFEILFNRNSLTTIDNEITNNDLILSNTENAIVVKVINSNITSFKAYDVMGKLVIDTNPNKGNFTINTNLDSGTVLFIKTTLENGQVLDKKFVKL